MKHHLFLFGIESFLFVFLLLIVATPIVVSFNLDPHLVSGSENDQETQVLGETSISEHISPVFSSYSVHTSGNITVTSQSQTQTTYRVDFLSLQNAGTGEHMFSQFYNPSKDPLIIWVTLELNAQTDLGSIIVDNALHTSSSVVIPPRGVRSIGMRMNNPEQSEITGSFILETE